MNEVTYREHLDRCADVLKQIRDAAWALHESVGQHYDGTLPYGVHLDAVADFARRFAAPIIADAADIVPILFAAYYHDSIEDARLSYNDVRRTAARYMNDAQALTAAEMVYALTNDKGRTRAERAGERYYAGIRTTPYAPFLKLCDRAANAAHSHRGTNDENRRMALIYNKEWPHFLDALRAPGDDVRLSLPEALIAEVEDCMKTV